MGKTVPDSEVRFFRCPTREGIVAKSPATLSSVGCLAYLADRQSTTEKPPE